MPGEARLYSKMTGRELLHYFAKFRPEKPPVLKDELVERFDLDLRVKGRDINHVVKALAQFKVKDLVFAHASLEEVFLEFYGREGT